MASAADAWHSNAPHNARPTCTALAPPASTACPPLPVPLLWCNASGTGCGRSEPNPRQPARPPARPSAARQAGPAPPTCRRCPRCFSRSSRVLRKPTRRRSGWAPSAAASMCASHQAPGCRPRQAPHQGPSMSLHGAAAGPSCERPNIPKRGPGRAAPGTAPATRIQGGGREHAGTRAGPQPPTRRGGRTCVGRGHPAPPARPVPLPPRRPPAAAQRRPTAAPGIAPAGGAARRAPQRQGS